MSKSGKTNTRQLCIGLPSLSQTQAGGKQPYCCSSLSNARPI